MEENKNVELEDVKTEETEQVQEQNVEEEQKDAQVVSQTSSEEKPPKKSRKELKKEKEEARKKELATLSDDELYARLQTEKLLKTKRNKKIATFSSLVVAFVLALSVIIMAIVPYTYVPTCLSGDLTDVKLYKSGSSTTAVACITEDDDRYANFQKLLKSAFQQNFLTALFSGSISSYEIDEKNGVSSSDSDTVMLSDALSLAGDNYLIQFNFATEQTFTYQSGKAYYSVYSGGRVTLTYKTAYLAVSTDEDSGITTTDLFIVGIYSATTRIFTVSVKADTSIIYSNWSSLLS